MRKKLFCPKCKQGLVYTLAQVYVCIDCFINYDENLQELSNPTKDAPDVATVCPNCNYMATYPICTKCGTSIPATQVI